MIDGTVAPVTTSQAKADVTVDLGQTYYWKVVEINEAETPASWAGPVWSFSTKTALVVDDFESYTDDDGKRIYQAWIDGWDAPNTNGAVVGYSQAPFAERTIIYGGKQSMPLAYNNSPAASSQAERTFDAAQDWTKYGLKTLSLMFYGDPNNTGQMYLKINNTKVVYSGSAEDLKRAQWQPWNIDLASTGANLESVAKLAIGIEGAGASGMLYIDDIRLYPQGGRDGHAGRSGHDGPAGLVQIRRRPQGLCRQPTTARRSATPRSPPTGPRPGPHRSTASATPWTFRCWAAETP